MDGGNVFIAAGTAAWPAERPAMDGRAGRSGACSVTPWMAARYSSQRALPRGLPNDRHGWPGRAIRSLQRHAMDGSKVFIAAGTAAWPAERPAMDGRAGRSGACSVTRRMAARYSSQRALPRGLPNDRPWMAGPGDPEPAVSRHGWG